MYNFENVTYKNILTIQQATIKQREITCVVGTSGGGKTTFLRLLGKLISPTEGHILYEGDVLDQVKTLEYRKEVVMMGQKPYLFPGTIQDNLERALKYHQLTRTKEELEEVLKQVHLNKPLSEETNHLSGGEQQRLALARLLLLKPKVILLDEPSSALDEDTEQWMIKHVCEFVKKEGKTLIMVTHSKRIAREYADAILTLENGMIKETDSHE